MTVSSSAASRVDYRHPQYQELKSRIHQELLNRLNLERLTRVRREEAEPEIRGLIASCSTRESAKIAAQPVRARALIADVLNELFGLGPARGAARTTRRSRTSWSTATTRSTSSARACSRRPTSRSRTTPT